ncbi:DCD domain-containing protein NRP-A-like [Gastrolobium bilobum]|uniref:DCD domain-containing protein NRP-A-like n=1 Tax=Gastrolobium bilobum TaxID=150636 RepID=UPI002AB293F7|nr:DCD domain-containing protein NRP-A-like [Gastrolobium bilobum]
MDNNNNQQSFWQFSDQLRLHTSNLANLSLNDSIWSNNYTSKSHDQRRNFDVKGSGVVDINSFTDLNSKPSDFKDGWKMTNSNGPLFSMPLNNINDNTLGGFNKGIYTNTSSSYVNLNNNNNLNNINLKGYKSGFKGQDEFHYPTKSAKKNTNINNNKKHGDNNDVTKTAADKRFKTLPPSESLPRDEIIGGYIFVCNNDTMAENLQRQLFGLPPRYRDSVRTITPGLPLFLYNYSTHQLHGIFEAASFGGTNIDPAAWEDKKCPGESRFPAQVQVITRKVCEPLEEDSFRPILHHYDGPKFRLELSVAEALSLLDIFANQNSFNDIFKAIPA